MPRIVGFIMKQVALVMTGRMNMREVAGRAGVSVATVSRALKAPGKVSAATRERVREAAVELGYHYNAAAGDIFRGRSSVVGLLFPMASTSLFGDTLRGVQDVTSDVGFSIMQGTTRYDECKEHELIDSFLQRRVQGLILTGMTFGVEARVEELASRAQLRAVVIWEKPRADSAVSYVGFDNREAARRATWHLLGLGHQRIGLIVGPFSQTARARQRLEGYREALEQAGATFDEDLVLERRPNLLEGLEAMSALMSRQEPPTAVFAASDHLAIGAMKAARQMGIDVPGDVSIIGFDDVDMAAYQNPPLTTVRVDAYKIGQLAMQTAIEPLGTPARRYCLDSDLVIRGSTGPARPG